MRENKHVLLITIDSLRTDHVSCLGYDRRTTPHIDNLAQTGCLFTQAIVNGSPTPSSFPSLLTSSYPSMYGYNPHLSKSRTTVAEVLRAKGYNTAAFHSNPYLSRYYGYDRGFDTFEDFMFSKLVHRRHGLIDRFKNMIIKYTSPNFPPRRIYLFTKGFIKKRRNYIHHINTKVKTADVINENAVLWLGQNTGNFFIWIHYMDAHFPYIVPDKYLNQLQIEGVIKSKTIELSREMRWKQLKGLVSVSKEDLQMLVDLYDGGIRYADDAVGSLLMELSKAGVYDDTLIIITADHGEEFHEHGNLCHRPKLYDELIRVPLIIKCPGMDEGVVIDHQVQHLDIVPTILDILGIEKPINFQGTSFKALMQKKCIENAVLTGVISETVYKGKRRVCYRTEEWKYILDEGTDLEELYNLQNDPGEKNNMVHVEPEKLVEFRAIIKGHIRSVEERSKEAVIATEKKEVKRKIEKMRKA